MRADDGELLRAFLAGRSVACPSCGYDLRGLTGAACPECGRQLSLSVAGVEQPLGPFVAILMASMLTTGMGLLFLNAVVVWGWPPNVYETAVTFSLAASGINIVAAGLLIRRRERFLGLARPVQVRWAVAIGLLQAVVLALGNWFWPW